MVTGDRTASMVSAVSMIVLWVIRLFKKEKVVHINDNIRRLREITCVLPELEDKHKVSRKHNERISDA